MLNLHEVLSLTWHLCPAVLSESIWMDAYQLTVLLTAGEMTPSQCTEEKSRVFMRVVYNHLRVTRWFLKWNSTFLFHSALMCSHVQSVSLSLSLAPPLPVTPLKNTYTEWLPQMRLDQCLVLGVVVAQENQVTWFLDLYISILHYLMLGQRKSHHKNSDWRVQIVQYF